MIIRKAAILDPMKTIEEIKPILFKMYQKDYHLGDQSELNNRWDNTIFITDVLPTDEKKFIDEWGKEGYSSQQLQRLEEEYQDYKEKEEYVRHAAATAFSKYLMEEYGVPTITDVEKVWNLPLDAIEAMNIDSEHQEQAAEVCKVLGIEIGTDENAIKNIIRKKERLQENININLIHRTLWGKRIKQQYPKIPAVALASFFYGEATQPETSQVLCTDNRVRTICFLPLKSQKQIDSLDRIVLQELRKVVETTENKCGLSISKLPEYGLINEARTAMNAMRDEQQLPVIFSGSAEIRTDDFDQILPTLSKTEESVLNQLAFQEDQSEIEGICKEFLDNLTSEAIRKSKNLRKTRITQ